MTRTNVKPLASTIGATKPVYTGADMLNDALAVMDAVGWANSHVMGGSMGAAIAQSLALLHPDRVRARISCMGAPATAGPLRTLSYIHFGIFKEFRKFKPAGTRQMEIDTLVRNYRAIASPGYPFPEKSCHRYRTSPRQRSS